MSWSEGSTPSEPVVVVAGDVTVTRALGTDPGGRRRWRARSWTVMNQTIATERFPPWAVVFVFQFSIFCWAAITTSWCRSSARPRAQTSMPVCAMEWVSGPFQEPSLAAQNRL